MKCSSLNLYEYGVSWGGQLSKNDKIYINLAIKLNLRYILNNPKGAMSLYEWDRFRRMKETNSDASLSEN